DNWSGTPGTFNLDLRVIQGTDLVVSGVPTGAINANTPVTFTVSFTKTAVPGTTWEGLLYIGPVFAPTALEIPVTVRIITPTVNVLLSVDKFASAGWVREGDIFTYTITLRNLGTYPEYVALRDPLPPMVEFVPGSQRATKGTLFLDIIAREARWTDWVSGGETVTMTFQVRASSGRGWVENVVSVSGAISRQRVEGVALTFVNPLQIYLPLVMKNYRP
ncbi:MAG: hypothetical protein RMK30_04840, partial [Anaerolineae bacterium]|nr:hypothetical protein [Anaerolineae bacterium]